MTDNQRSTKTTLQTLPHDLIDAEQARVLLNMPLAKFELLVSSGRLPIFRSSGRTCFRREDIAALVLKRQSVQVSTATTDKKPCATKAAEPKNAVRKAPDKYADTQQTMPGLRPKAERPAIPTETKPALQSRSNSKTDEESESDDQKPVAQTVSRWSNRKWFAVGGAAIAIFVAMTFIGATSGRVETTVVQPTSNPAAIANCKGAPGLVESASGERRLSFEVAGKLRAVYVEEGQVVKAGLLIAELENADLAAKVKSSQAELSAAVAKLGILQSNLESDLKKAESEVVRLKAELLLLEPRQEDVEQVQAEANAMAFDARRLAEDAEKLSKAGLGLAWSQQQFDQAKGLAEAANAKCEAAKAKLRALKAGSRPEERIRMQALLASAESEVTRQKATNSFQTQSAQAQVDVAKAQVDLAKAELDKTKIVSVIDGTVVRKYMQPGEVIDALHSQPVVTVVDMSNLRVRAAVDEADFPQIAVGQHVRITADALEDGKYFSGTVVQISHVTGQKRFSTGEAKERMDVKIVETVVKFNSPPLARLIKLGLRVTAYFEIGSDAHGRSP